MDLLGDVSSDSDEKQVDFLGDVSASDTEPGENVSVEKDMPKQCVRLKKFQKKKC